MAANPDAERFMKAFIDVMNKSELPLAEIQRRHEEPVGDLKPQDLTGKVIIVTGANTGIGFEIAKSLASMNPKKLILACRNLDKARVATDAIKKETGFKEVEEWALDLASFASVRAFAQKFIDTKLPLDLLVSNAGLGGMHDWTETEDGFEIICQVNHLANVLLVLLLTPALKQAPNSRCVVVASEVHFWSPLTPEDPHPVKTALTKAAPGTPNLFCYLNSKLFNVLFVKEYARRCPYPIWICSSNPGYTKSELGMKDPKTGDPKEVHRPQHIKMRSTYDGAKTIIHSAITPETGEKGSFYSELGVSHSRSSTQGEVGKQFADKVWRETIAILKEKSGVPKFEDWVEK